MSNAFGNVVTSSKVQEQKDTVGGASYTEETGVYPVNIRAIYLTESPNSKVANIIYVINGNERTMPLYYADKEGKNYSVIDGKDVEKQGWHHLRSILKLGAGIEPSQANMVERTLQIYNMEKRAKVPTKVNVVEQAIGINVQFALVKVNKPKQRKMGDKWVDTDAFIDVNDLEKVLNTDGYTLTELVAQSTERVFLDTVWKEKRPEGFVKKITPKGAVVSADAKASQEDLGVAASAALSSANQSLMDDL